MATKAINFKFTGATTPVSAYDETKTNLGSLIKQYTGITYADKFAGAAKIGIARPMEQSTPIPGIYPHVIPFSDTIDWVFLADNATAAATRRYTAYAYNKNTSEFNWKGFITVTFPTATNHTIRGLRVTRDLHTTGTVAVSGTAVTGTSTTWQTNSACVGNRIGFGSNDPTQITTWYQISAIGSNTGITLTASAGTITAGTPYVIEDLRIISANTNATTTNGGLFVVKGLSWDAFITGGTTIPAATTVDNIRACYWLADASTVTNITACGCALDDFDNFGQQFCYIIDSTGAKIYKYNLRAALTLTSGKATNAFTLVTGNQAVTGTMSNTNNGRIGTLNHGPGSGVKSLYFVTTTRIYRVIVSNITSGSTTWQQDVMLEIPPGSVTTYAASGALASIEITNTIDRLIVITTGANGNRSYVTQYNTISSPMDHIFLVDDKQNDQSIADSGGVIHPSTLSLPFSVWVENGIMYLARMGTTVAQNQLYSLPLGAHRTYALDQNQLLISPKITLTNPLKLYSICVQHISAVGSATLSLATEPFTIYYRTSGISDNSGTWLELSEDGDLSGISATDIQFAFAFRVLGTTCIPGRILGFSLIYEDNSGDDHYTPSVANSSIASRIFAYRQSLAWGSNIPVMRIRLYNASSGVLLLDDTTTANAFGTFEYSSNNGSTWNTWLNTADVAGNYIRYTATSLPAGIRVRALLTIN
ncbi:MAG: hypothetical protein E6R13_08605 [Spirochaetes bacterium]|nr:MAG: hypothetical protein E6R13_08605 [Spirochaetota bacterium]